MSGEDLKPWIGTLLLVIVLGTLPQFIPTPTDKNAPIYAKHTRKHIRKATREETLYNIILPGLLLSPDAAHDSQWQRVLYRMKASAYAPGNAIPALQRLFAVPDFSDETKRLLFETIYALYDEGFEDAMRQALAQETEPRRFSMAAVWLDRRFHQSPSIRNEILTTMHTRFPSWRDEPRYEALHSELTEPRAQTITKRPPLTDLLSAPFDGLPVIFSFQRLHRDYEGRAVVRDRQGRFLRDPDGTIFSAAQLARSVNNLPGTLTNGNTPQGIFEARKFGHSSIAAIGPTTTLELGMPGEYDKTWTRQRYQALLPPSWQDYWPVYESWWAGQAGRFDIIAHGTTKDPEHWRDAPFYPNTPSHGCLTALETWDPGDGHRVISEQARLIKALKRAGGLPAWLIVVEVDAKRQAITQSEASALVPRPR